MQFGGAGFAAWIGFLELLDDVGSAIHPSHSAGVDFLDKPEATKPGDHGLKWKAPRLRTQERALASVEQLSSITQGLKLAPEFGVNKSPQSIRSAACLEGLEPPTF